MGSSDGSGGVSGGDLTRYGDSKVSKGLTHGCEEGVWSVVGA